MDNRILALIGVALLVVGVFLPVANMGPEGSVNLLSAGGNKAAAIVLLVLAAVAGLLAATGRVRHVLWPGLLALAFLIWKLLQLKGEIDGLAGRLDGMPGAAEMLARLGVGLNYLGWGVLIVGAILICAAGAMAMKGPSAPPPTV